jgi:hypothetical protein
MEKTHEQRSSSQSLTSEQIDALWTIDNPDQGYLQLRRALDEFSELAEDPEHSLSPFSKETAVLRPQDISYFERAVEASGLKLPSNLAPYLPRLLWMYQMG